MAERKIQSDSTEKRVLSNPFPSSAVARLSPTATELLTITTDAVRKATSYLEDYLSRGGAVSANAKNDESQGSVIAIVGEHGTGKTHIALELLQRITASDAAELHLFYLDAPADTFLVLYKERFMLKLQRLDVRDRVEEYLADIVAEDLAKSGLTSKAAEQLRLRAIPPLELVRNLGLMESEFMQRLHNRLRLVTEHEDFGTAFSLFLRPEFENAVWEWLQGNPPDDALVDRGIKRTLDSDPAVLETIGVLAFLFGRQNHRFVLVIDEMEKVLSHSTPRRPDEATVLAFKKLMEAMGKTRALLILGGLPDFLEVLPDDAQQRISCIVRPTALTPDDTAQYILEAQNRATGQKRLKPFTSDTVAYVSEIAGGNARKVVRLCYHAFQAANDAGTDVTRAMLREAAREQFELTTTEDVSTEISRTIDLNGWLFEAEKLFGESAEGTRVDFWIPVGDKGAGCAIMISRSLLHESEVGDLADRMKRVQATQSSEARILGLLVVNGYLAENLAPIVQKAFDRVILFSVRRFSDDIDAALKGAIRRIEESYREDNIALIRDRVGQIARQTNATRSTLDDLSHIIPNANLIERTVERGLRAVFGQLSGQNKGKESDPRFPRVTSEFDRAEAIIATLRTSIDQVFDLVSPIGLDSHSPRKRRRRPGRDIIMLFHDDEFTQYLAAVNIIDQLVSVFRKWVFAELSRIDSGLRGKESYIVIREVRRECESMFDPFHYALRGSKNLTQGTTLMYLERYGIEIPRVEPPDIDSLEQLPFVISEAIEYDGEPSRL